MKTISVSELKARLSEQLRSVRAGESVIVTDRGNAVAILAPLPASALEDELAELVAAGLIRPAQNRLEPEFWNLERPEDPDATLRTAVSAERADSW